jgi:hypothetical protein
MESKYNIYWTDMHSNIHHEKMADLDIWYQHIKKLMDFWPIAYYPYYLRPMDSGWKVEDSLSPDIIKADWEQLRSFTNNVNEEGFPMFMGYEWQGSGLDGDHNVFFKDNDQDAAFPLRYQELLAYYKGKSVIAIPHHLAYQIGNRGKNWDTHDDEFSPFAEIYSSHGSSENDTDSIPMNRHIHMGPRTGQNTLAKGWARGYRFGVIASGDNHSVPGTYEFGTMACLATNNTKEAIWDAMIKRRVYGVSKDRIKLDFNLNEHPMGSEIIADSDSVLTAYIEGSDRLDRVEIIADNRVIEVIPMLSPIRNDKPTDMVRCKFKIEFGWGPDRRIFPDIFCKEWIGSLKIQGNIISIEKCWNNFGQKLENIVNDGFDFTMITYKNEPNDKWMGTAANITEGFIVEIESRINASIHLEVNRNNYDILISDILNSSQIINLSDESFDLINSNYGLTEYYRNDPWWHNSYKIKIGQGARFEEYEMIIDKTIDTNDISNLRLRVWQNNGSVAWSSPIFIRKE